MAASRKDSKGRVLKTGDVREGDQLNIDGNIFSIIEVHDNWIWNKIANYTVAVK